MSRAVDDDASSSSSGATATAMSSSHPHMLMVQCNAMAWTNVTKKEEEGLLKVLVNMINI